MTKDRRLSQRAYDEIERALVVVLSVASLWEIGIKHGLGKLDFGVPLVRLIEDIPREKGIVILPIEPRHILRAAALPLHHRDPFDRMIVAQGLEEDLPIVGSDGVFDAYGVRRVF